MALQPARVFDLEHDMHLIPQMAQVHHDCIVNDFTMVTFLPPLDLSKIIDYWQGWTEEMRAGGRVLFIQCVKHESRPEEVAGVVCLNLPVSGTGPFRSQVNKLLVSPKHRYKGIARSLLAKLEEVAKQKDRWLVVSREMCFICSTNQLDARHNDWQWCRVCIS